MTGEEDASRGSLFFHQCFAIFAVRLDFEVARGTHHVEQFKGERLCEQSSADSD